MMFRICYAGTVLLALVGAMSEKEDDQKSPGKHKDDKREYAHSDAAEVLKLIISDWMTNPTVKHEPYSYLIDPDNELEKRPKLERLLIDKRYIPKSFDLEIRNVKVELFDRSIQRLRNGELYIRIDLFKSKKDGTIEVQFLHTGYGFQGGAFVTYLAIKKTGKWTVEYSESFDP